MELVRRSWIDDVYERRLLPAGRAAQRADGDDAEASAVVAACESIGDAVRTEIARLEPAIDRAGLSASLSPAGDGGDQIHAMVAEVADFDEASRLASMLGAESYRPWQRWSGGALESFRRSTDTITVARTDQRTDVLNITWPSASKLGRIPSVVRPNEADWSFVSLPRPLWWLYFLIRPLRLIGERTGLVQPGPGHLGPFLATPSSLIDPLLDFAAVTADDVVVDLGCGDGRLVVEAARRRGCRARGVETDAELVESARAAASTAGLAGLVAIEHGDAAGVSLDDVTVVFVFLPADVAAELLPTIVGRLSPGARVIAHEQHRLPVSIDPERSAVLVSDDAVTVAHRWTA